MNAKYKIKIEVACDDCQGAGKVCLLGNDQPIEGRDVTCSGCDGEGYQELTIGLEYFKAIMNGGDL